MSRPTDIAPQSEEFEMKHDSHSERRLCFRSTRTIGVSIVLASVAIWASPLSIRPTWSQNVVVVDVDVKEVAKGYRASRLTGSAVENSKGQKIGSIDDFIVDREKVLFAILQVGGFLGLGGFLVAIPYQSLEIRDGGSKIVLAAGSREDLNKLPEFKYQQK